MVSASWVLERLLECGANGMTHRPWKIHTWQTQLWLVAVETISLEIPWSGSIFEVCLWVSWTEKPEKCTRNLQAWTECQWVLVPSYCICYFFKKARAGAVDKWDKWSNKPLQCPARGKWLRWFLKQPGDSSLTNWILGPKNSPNFQETFDSFGGWGWVWKGHYSLFGRMYKNNMYIFIEHPSYYH